MDLQSYIQLKEAYVSLHSSKVEVPEDVVIEEVDAIILALVEEEGYDLSAYSWEECCEAVLYIKEAPNNDLGYRAGRAISNAAGDLVKGTGQSIKNLFTGKKDNAKNNPASARQQKRLGSIGDFVKTGKMPSNGAPTTNTSGSNGSRKGGMSSAEVNKASRLAATQRAAGASADLRGGGGNTKPATTKPATTTQKVKPTQTPQQKKDSSTNAKYDQLRKSDPAAAKKFGMDASKKKFGNQLKPKTANPLMKDLQKRMPKPAAPKPAAAPKADSSQMRAMSKSTPAAKPMSRIAKATSNIKPMKFNEEVTEFDLILAHLTESGFAEDEALKLMINMDADKRQEIIESYLTEEESDALKDRRQERGGVDGNTDYRRAPKAAPKGEKRGKTAMQKDAEAKYGKGASAMDIVRAKIKAQYGDKAIMDTKKKES